MILAFPSVGNKLVWCVGRRTKLQVGMDPWIGSGENYMLPHHIIMFLGSRGFYNLSWRANLNKNTICHQGWLTRRDLVSGTKMLILGIDMLEVSNQVL
jgi:hypothetical protein